MRRLITALVLVATLAVGAVTFAPKPAEAYLYRVVCASGMTVKYSRVYNWSRTAVNDCLTQLANAVYLEPNGFSNVYLTGEGTASLRGTARIWTYNPFWKTSYASFAAV